MNGSASGVGHIGHALGVFRCQYHAAATVVGIFQADQGRWREMDVGLGPDGGLYVGRADAPLVVIGNQAGLGSGQGSRPRRFVPENVGLVAHNDFVATVTIGQQSNQIAHGAAGGEQTGLFAQYLRRPFLQPVDGRVFAKNVVSDFGFSHCPPHLIGGFGYCVTAQIDDCHPRLQS